MISQRTLDGEIYGKVLKGRVAACRKRLRINRMEQMAQVNNEAEELFPETTTNSLNYRSPFTGPDVRGNEMLVLVGDQEVGIP
ncbi:MAG: hypothetical protein LC775_06270 [Acidobacteria bacterium]|nr:hypothetical protein [Acidobacteriota bacterium]